MPESIPNLYRRRVRPNLPPEAYYAYGAGPEYAFFDRMPVPIDEAPVYEEFAEGDYPFPEQTEGGPEIPGVGQTLVAMGAPAAGGYLGSKVGRFMGEGQGFGDAITSSFSEVGVDIAGLLPGGGEAAGSIASNSIATAPVSYGGPTFALDGAAPAAGNVASGAAQGLSGAAGKSAASGFGDKLFSSSNIGGAVGVGLGSALGGLIMGKSPKKAALGGVGSAVGYGVGNAIFPGVGGFIGGALGGLVGGRVICTELHRQRMLSIDLLRCELNHTRTRISDTTRRGYLAWAVPYTRLMRRHPIATRVMRPIAVARALEIAHVMGRRDRPHWGGRLVRLLGEPACWAIGAAVKTVEAFYNAERKLAPCG